MSVPIERLDEYRWRIPAGSKPGMKVPAIIFADDRLMDQIKGDLSLEQAMNAATLPGVVRAAYTMPDIHQGYGLPIGAVVATRTDGGVVTPGGVGYDINCGVRLLRTELTKTEVLPRLKELVNLLFTAIPSGVGSHGKVRLTKESQARPLVEGARWAVAEGMGEPEDLVFAEAGGCIPGADPDAVSHKAYERGRDQAGTLGSGNHFEEVQVVDQIYDEQAANVMGLFPGQVTVLLHTGSRGFGHQVCTDYVKSFQSAVERYRIRLPDRELVCAPLDSPEGQAYQAAMRCAANYAFANRQLLAHDARAAFAEALRGRTREPHLHQVYDIAHNMGKTEEHVFDGVRRRVCVHRKGATRAFGPGFEDLPPEYRAIGQPVLVPGSMGTASWVLVGTEGSMERSLGSCCHGAGRTMSRSRAKRTIHGGTLRQELEARGIRIRAGSLPGLAEEAPAAYKDVDAVVDAVEAAGIARKVARLRPVAVVKG